MSTSFAPPKPSCCRNCGAHISEDFARVFGDQSNDVHACMECSCQEHLFAGGAADPTRERRVGQALYERRREINRRHNR